VLNELLTNACKHRSANSMVAVKLEANTDDVIITIANHFYVDQLEVRSNGQGLNLVKSLLPRNSANLTVVCAGDVFSVELKLSPPVTIAELNGIQ